jgi:hypothetical protein
MSQEALRDRYLAPLAGVHIGVYQGAISGLFRVTRYNSLKSGKSKQRKGLSVYQGFAESPSSGLGIPCSIRLSYGGTVIFQEVG